MKTITVILLMLLAQISFSQNSDWVYRNPNPQNDFYGIKFFDQNTGYVVGSNGIILKNTTGSNNWATINGNTINDLYGIYFFDVNHGYIVGAGGLIMNTTDGGATWTHIVADSRYALRSITFVNQNKGFIAGDNGELYRTTTGLYGWMPISLTSRNLRKVVATDSLHIFAVGDSGVFLKSVNGGLNWTTQTVGTGNIYAVAFRDSLNGIIYPYNSPVQRTTNGGVTWVNQSQFYNDEYMSAKFVNSMTGYAVGIQNPIIRTTDGGLNWAVWGSGRLMGMDAIYDICPVDSFTAFCCGLRGFVIKSVDTVNAMFHYYQTPLGGARVSLSSISFLNANTGAMIGNSTYFYTTNGGALWQLKYILSSNWFEGMQYLIGAKMVPPASAYRMGYSQPAQGFATSWLEHSTDGGITWNGPFGFSTYSMGGFFGRECEVQGTAYITSYGGILKNTGTGGWVQQYYNNTYYPGGITFANPNTGFACGGGSVSGILRTTNGGTNWNFQSLGVNHLPGIGLLRPSGVGYIAGDSSFIMRTYDFGANWTLLSSGGNQSIQDMNFVTDNVGWYLGQAGYPGPRRLFYTNNGGTDFQQLQSLMNFNVNGFSFVDANTGYVCGDSGVVLKTTNGGITFVNPAIENLPKEFSLSQNYPNPFNPNTVIKFQVASYKFVKLAVYDVLGREVVKLINQQMQPGNYSVDWDGTNYPSGVYFYKLTTGDFVQTKKMVLVK